MLGGFSAYDDAEKTLISVKDQGFDNAKIVMYIDGERKSKF